MSHDPTNNWLEDNQRYMMAALGEVRAALARQAHSFGGDVGQPEQAYDVVPGAEEEIAAAMPAAPALEALAETFRLTPFERVVLLMTAGMELDSTFADLCAAAQGEARRAYPTFSLALAAWPEAHWSALSPAGPLRYWRLVEVGNGDTLASSPLRLDERVLHYLVGAQHLDERLVGLVESAPGAAQLVPSQGQLAERLALTWAQAAGSSSLPVAQLLGADLAAKQAVAVAACANLGLNLYRMSAQDIPASAAELEALARLWEREAALGNNALLLDCQEGDAADTAREHVINRLVESLNSPLIIAGRERRGAGGRPSLTFDVHKPTNDEQRALWQHALGGAGAELNGSVEPLVAQFDLSPPDIQAATAQALGQVAAEEGEPSPHDLESALWAACRVQARPQLSSLIQPLRPAAGWDDLVLPPAQKQVLSEIAVHVRQRLTVYESWGFAAKSVRGLGVSALFSGPSGTGKTMAAEVLANELKLDVYRIDLSQVVSKYIGETEKNLGRVFDAAEAGGAILLFDEADALFGKRSEVKDSHDRYANIEVSYLLQRMEDYRGLAILTTNLKDALDSAFLRRIRFIVRFPFPGPVERAEIWRHIFPGDTPTEGLDADKLARLNVAGGNIRNIALNAAFLAADTGGPVRMAHLLHAARGEYGKLEKSLTEAEIRGWE